MPGYHVQIDVKLLAFPSGSGGSLRRFQYSAIDDATRIRSLKTYSRHNQASAIDSIGYAVEKARATQAA